MDIQKMGTFLKELRKENNMTQEQLGDRIGVSNKTISRWETGKYLPPVENLKQLSDIYQISINELLAGERLTNEQYTEAADINVSNILEEMEDQNKKIENKLVWIMILTSVLAVLIIALLPNEPKSILIIVMVAAMAFISNSLNIALCVAAMSQKKK